MVIKRISKKTKKTINGIEKIIERPIIVTLTEGVKPKVMKNLYKLKDSEQFRHISIKHDMSKEEKEKEQQLKSEAKRLNETEENQNFLYVVRGMPWERYVKKITKNY